MPRREPRGSRDLRRRPPRQEPRKRILVYDMAMGRTPEDTSAREVALSTNLTDPTAIPYFLWDEPMTVQNLRARLSGASQPERLRLLAKVLREARDTEVWLFTTPQEVACQWPALAPRLGRRRSFWEFLLSEWERQGRLELNKAR